MSNSRIISEDIINTPTEEDMISCLRGQNAITQWRPRPSDPYIYVSFAMKDYLTAYSNDIVSLQKAVEEGIEEIERPVMEIYKSALQKEWIERAEMPVKFLPPGLTQNQIQKKNVYFVFATPLKQNDAKTIAFNYPDYFTDQSNFKIGVLPKVSINNLSNLEVYFNLHEAGHALAELKHPRLYDEKTDSKPFCQIDCTQSVMVYNIHCPPVMNVDQQEFIRQLEKAMNDGGYDYDTLPEGFSFTHQENKEGYPVELKQADLLAAKDFKNIWNQRNKKNRNISQEKKTVTSAMKDSSKNILSAVATEEIKISCDDTVSDSFAQKLIDVFCKSPSQFLYNQLNNFLDTCIEKLQQGAIETVQACPSYFPRNDVTKSAFWEHLEDTEKLPGLTQTNLPCLLFSNTQHNNRTMTVMPRIAPTSMPKLN